MPELIIPKGTVQPYQSIIPFHCHDRAQLLYASEGTIRVHTATHIWIVPPQCALWIPAYMQHSVITLSHVRLSTALVEEKAAQRFGTVYFLVRMSNLLRELVVRLNQSHPYGALSRTEHKALEQALQLLIFNEIQQASTYPIEIPWPQDPRLITICTALLTQPSQLKSLSFWAEQIGVSPRTLIRLFQKETGLPYRAWIQQMHLALALGKLSRGESVSRVAHALGYQNSSAFSAMFKKHLGTSPQTYKQR